MKKIFVIAPKCIELEKSHRLNMILKTSLKGYNYQTIDSAFKLESTKANGCSLIFAVNLGDSGINLEYFNMLKLIRNRRDLFTGCVGGLIVDGSSELFTKSIARDLVFSANRSGCTFPGAPLVEGTGTLDNFNTTAKNLDTDNMGAYLSAGRDLMERVVNFKKPEIQNPRILALHVGNPTSSNTLMLWDMVKKNLEDIDIKEISLRDGQVRDCIGCDYETCLHFGEKKRCFYGGIITSEVYPTILDCHGLVMLCANYNDAVSAYLAAFINRLTALFRVYRFFDKRLYSVIVSGYSGSDIVAQQLIAGLNMNKTFFLPPEFALMETANNPGAILNVDGIKDRARDFGESIMREFATCKTKD